jgi:hypothetical protein
MGTAPSCLPGTSTTVALGRSIWMDLTPCLRSIHPATCLRSNGIFSGQAGGPLAGFPPFIGEVLGVKTATIEYRAEGKRRSIRLGDIAEAEIDGLPGPDGNDVTVANAPFATDPGVPLVVAKSKQMRFSDYGLKWEVSNKTGFFSPFSYQSA